MNSSGGQQSSDCKHGKWHVSFSCVLNVHCEPRDDARWVRLTIRKELRGVDQKACVDRAQRYVQIRRARTFKKSGGPAARADSDGAPPMAPVSRTDGDTVSGTAAGIAMRDAVRSDKAGARGASIRASQQSRTRMEPACSCPIDGGHAVEPSLHTARVTAMAGAATRLARSDIAIAARASNPALRSGHATPIPAREARDRARVFWFCPKRPITLYYADGRKRLRDKMTQRIPLCGISMIGHEAGWTRSGLGRPARIALRRGADGRVCARRYRRFRAAVRTMERPALWVPGAGSGCQRSRLTSRLVRRVRAI